MTSPYHILIIDDSDLVRNLISRMVQHAYPSARISKMANGKAALDCFASDGADLIITDAYMTPIDGVALTTMLRSQDVQVPIVILSGDSGVEPLARKAGASAFIMKPFSSASLAKELHQLLPQA